MVKTGDISSINLDYNMNKEIFEEDLLNEDFKIYYYRQGTYVWQKMSTFLQEKFPELYNKYIMIKQKEKTSDLDLELNHKQCQIEKSKVKRMNAKEIIDSGSTTILDQIHLGKYNSLIRYLISKGYINENYPNYITQFHEGSITINDYAYIVAVQSRETLPFDAPIDNPRKVIERLSLEEFDRPEILNKYIFDELLSNITKREKLDKFINVFILHKDYIKIFQECMTSFIFKNKTRLLEFIFKPDDQIWNRIDSRIYSLQQKIELIKTIICIDIKALTTHKQKEDMGKFINENNIIIQDINIMKQLIENVKIKYTNISTLDLESKILDYIIKTNSYEINNDNILRILQKNVVWEQTAKSKNYECLQKIDNVKEYIDSNINEYINNVYLKLETEQNNSEETFIHLLNLEEIDKELIEKILQKETKQIKDIEQVNDELWDMLLDNEKIESDYANINKYYEKNGLNQILINYINKKQSIKEFVTLNEGEKIEKYLNEKLVKDIICENKILLPLYKEVILNAKTRYKWLKVSHLDEEKVIFLMQNEIFTFNIEMYNRIRKCNNKIFIEYTKKYIRNIQSTNINDIDYDINEINALICSDEFTHSLKSKVIGYIKDEDIDNITDEMINNICNCILKYNIKNNLSEKLLIKILNTNKNIDENVKIIVFNARLVNIDNVEEILKTLGTNYLKIIQDRTTPVLKNTIYNKYLISIIKELGYNIDFYEEDDNNIKLKGTKRGKLVI